MTPTLCPYCGSDLISNRMDSQDTVHFGRVICLDCNRTLRWLAKPMTLERAKLFSMPVGKHKGKTLEEIQKIEPDYLAWIANQSTEMPGAKRAAAYLIQHSQEPV